MLPRPDALRRGLTLLDPLRAFDITGRVLIDTSVAALNDATNKPCNALGLSIAAFATSTRTSRLAVPASRRPELVQATLLAPDCRLPHAWGALRK